MILSNHHQFVLHDFTQATALAAVLDERKQQDEQWGVSNHDPVTWLAILTEQVGKASLATVRRQFETVPMRRVRHRTALRISLVKVAAVALAFVECLDRGGDLSESAEEVASDE